MRGSKRIALIVFVLIGGVSLFGYWSIRQINLAIDDLSAPYLANTNTAYTAFTQNVDSDSTPLEISGETATSTSSTSTPTTNNRQLTISTTTPRTSTTTPTTATSTVPELSFSFPESNTQVYIGCTYPLSWESSAAISSLETALIDAGTKTPLGPKTSGLAKESVLEKDSEILNWKVGLVWPGAYYIKISKINDFKAEVRSKTFMISKMPEGIDTSEQKSTCKKSGGTL